MAGVWGNNLKISIFGESHGIGLGVVIDGLPAGLVLDRALIDRDMARRSPGRNIWSTPRKESDTPVVQSGIYNGRVTGAPMAMLISNTDQHSSDYRKLEGKARPGHADWTSYVKYHGFNDPRGSGHFSGRITAGLAFAGSVAKQYLSLMGIDCAAWITGIGKVRDSVRYPVSITPEWLRSLHTADFPLRDESLEKSIKDEITAAQKNDDSIGGTIAVCALGVPCGWGEPFFNSIESSLSSMLFSIPAVKGVEFGAGFQMAESRGSQTNDCWRLKNGHMETVTNNNGGINGGISNGMPVLAHVAIKPTSSISSPQNTVDFLNGKEIELVTGGRHDPCIVPRAVPVVEAAIAIVLLDFAITFMGRKQIEDLAAEKFTHTDI